MTEVIPKHDNLDIVSTDSGQGIVISQSSDTGGYESVYFHRRFLRDVIDALCAIERAAEDAA